MAISRIASQDAQGTSTAASSVSATYAATPTANNLLIAIVGDTDGNNNATAITGWTKVLPVGNQSGGNEVAILYKVSTGGESTTVTASTTAGTTANMAIYEYSGLATSSTLDQNTNGGSSLSNTGNTGTTGTTTVANELVIVCAFTTGTAVSFTSWSNGFNNLLTVSQTTFDLFTGDNIVSSKATYNSSLTVSSAVAQMSLVIATFKGISITTTVSPLSILGAG